MSIEVSPELFKKMAGSSLTKDRPEADVEQSLEDENTKLRELIRDMWNGMCGYEHDCRFCEHYELYEGQRFVGECEYHRRLRELGIEVWNG